MRLIVYKIQTQLTVYVGDLDLNIITSNPKESYSPHLIPIRNLIKQKN